MTRQLKPMKYMKQRGARNRATRDFQEEELNNNKNELYCKRYKLRYPCSKRLPPAPRAPVAPKPARVMALMKGQLSYDKIDAC